MNNWEESDLDKLEFLMNLDILNINQIRFLKTMVKFASMNIKPSEKQLEYLRLLWMYKVKHN